MSQHLQKYSLTTKYCNRCEVEKLASEFSKRKVSRDGLQSYCKNCSKTYLSEWQENNREHYNEYMRRYMNNAEHSIANLNRVRMYKALKKTPKTSSSISLLGTTISVVNLWLYFTGNYTSRLPLMHIDHFIPCAKFDLEDPAQQRECFNWMNLRTIPASKNLSKNVNLPTKAEYIDHINMCHDFVTENAGLVSDGKALHLMYNTGYRFWNQCP